MLYFDSLTFLPKKFSLWRSLQSLIQNLIVSENRQQQFFMAELCDKSYLDNECINISNLHLSNQMVIELQSSFLLRQKHQIKVYCWTKIIEFKSQVLSILNIQGLSIDNLRLFHKNIELNNQNKTLVDYSVGNGSVILIERRNRIAESSKGHLNPYKLFEKSNRKVQKLVENSQNAINSGLIPTLTIQGTSGVYIIKNQINQSISLFKPFDQEVNAPSNPRQMAGQLGSEGISKGILSGQCATREVAAYLLDSESANFHGVPTTTYVQFYHPTFIHQQNKKLLNAQNSLNTGKTKHGSLQQFISSEGIIGDYGSKKFTTKEIHKIAILDIRILNCDRNQENILVQQLEDHQKKLIPIDHGLSFPDNLAINEESLIWMSFPQSKIPFSEEQLKFIESINPTKDTEALKSKLGFRQICLRNFKIAEIFLKKCASMGFTLYEIGKMLYRTEESEQSNKVKRSTIQKVVMQAQNLYLDALQSREKENMQPIQEIHQIEKEQQSIEQINLQVELELEDSLNQDQSCESHSTSTCQSVKNFLALRKKTSLPQLKKKNTSFHQNREKARKQREGINGISKTIWNKYLQQNWNQLFYYYLQNLIDTLLEKQFIKTKRIPHRSESAK